MMIVLEGPDGGGKSTLAQTLLRELGLTYVPSEGPARAEGEIDRRIERYFLMKGDLLFDRHPCISQLAYRVVHDQPAPQGFLIDKFYKLKPILIYCRPHSSSNHQASGEWDTPEYLAAVDKNFGALMEWYDQWAVRRARYIYRIGDSIPQLVHCLKGEIYARLHG